MAFFMPKATNNLIILVSGYRVRQNSIGKSAKLWEHFENDRRTILLLLSAHARSGKRYRGQATCSRYAAEVNDR
jgi:hypothetical protein